MLNCLPNWDAMTKISEALVRATHRLTPQSPSARLDAEILLQHVLTTSRAFLYAHPEKTLTTTQADLYQQLIEERAQGMPVAYLTGHREFWSLPLTVNQATLIPRPETELLVELALTLLHTKKTATILDLGTGSGAIALALASEHPEWTIVATDKNDTAITMAKQNAAHLGLSNVRFFLSDWFEAIPQQPFDAILSNPPYIAIDDPHLNEGDLRFEPREALTSGIDGLDALTHLIKQAPAYLTQGGLLLVEHGFQQKKAVLELFQQADYKSIHCWQDTAGHDRVSGGLR